MGGGEGVLHDVLGFLSRPEHVPAERQDPRAVALEGDLERRIVSQPQLRDEAVVAGQRQQAAGSERPQLGPGLKRDGAHVWRGPGFLSGRKRRLTSS